MRRRTKASKNFRWIWWAWPLVLLLSTARGVCASPYDRCSPLGDIELDAMRGGMDLGAGIELSFGFQNVVVLNGELVAHSVFTLSPAMLANLPGFVQVIPDDPSTQLAPSSLSDLAFSTLIQNALDSQTIQSLSVINMSVTSLEFVNSLRLGDVLNGQTLGFQP